MAIKGLSKPVCANYTAVGNAVTYSDAYAADKAVEYSFEADVAEDKDLYADFCVRCAQTNINKVIEKLIKDYLGASNSRSYPRTFEENFRIENSNQTSWRGNGNRSCL